MVTIATDGASKGSNTATASTLTGNTQDRTYMDNWKEISTPVDYDTLCQEFKLHADPTDLVEFMLDTDPVTEPLCFLTLVMVDGQVLVVPHHSLTRALGGRDSPLRKAKIAVEGDIDRTTGIVTMRRFEAVLETMLQTEHLVLAPTVQGIKELRAKGDMTVEGLIPAIAESYSKSSKVTVLRCCPITLEQMMVLGTDMLTPLTAYDRLQEWNKGLAKPYKDFHALQWTRVASLMQYTDDTASDETYPPIYLGELDKTLPPLRVTRPEEARYMANRLKNELAERYQAPATGPSLADISKFALQSSGRTGTDGADTAATTATAERNWKTVNRYTYEAFCNLFGTTDETAFPEGIRRIITYQQKEWRGIMAQALDSAGGRSPGKSPVVPMPTAVQSEPSCVACSTFGRTALSRKHQSPPHLRRASGASPVQACSLHSYDMPRVSSPVPSMPHGTCRPGVYALAEPCPFCWLALARKPSSWWAAGEAMPFSPTSTAWPSP
mmetsp:Transcript_757/g.1761  ORF Transcript_757/g.1761 Transcript_757/m.1761 type:complete len:496 (-) Transcript_757:308-1795(-)